MFVKNVKEIKVLLANAGATDILTKAPSAPSRGSKWHVVYVPGTDEKVLRLDLINAPY